MDLELTLESFQRWFNVNHLTSNDITIIVLSIIMCVMLIFIIVMLVYLSRITLFWTRIGWAFEDLWHWLKTRRCLRSFLDPRYFFYAV